MFFQAHWSIWGSASNCRRMLLAIIVSWIHFDRVSLQAKVRCMSRPCPLRRRWRLESGWAVTVCSIVRLVKPPPEVREVFLEGHVAALLDVGPNWLSSSCTLLKTACLNEVSWNISWSSVFMEVDGEDGGEDEGGASRSSRVDLELIFWQKISSFFQLIFKYFPECLPLKSNRPISSTSEASPITHLGRA